MLREKLTVIHHRCRYQEAQNPLKKKKAKLGLNDIKK